MDYSGDKENEQVKNENYIEPSKSGTRFQPVMISTSNSKRTNLNDSVSKLDKSSVSPFQTSSGAGYLTFHEHLQKKHLY